eukprot:gene18106-24538_t
MLSFCNRTAESQANLSLEPGKPLFVSMLVYLNEEWKEEWNSETMFLDPESACGLFVRPQPGRMVLMDQDVPHRVSAPSSAAKGCPRYSLVWKLVFYPKSGDAAPPPSICRPQWGTPVRVGLPVGVHRPSAWPSA